MLERTSSARIVMTTVVSPEEGTRLGRTLVEEQLAACATLLPPVHSIYRWHDKIESSAETLLLLKTATDQLPALESRLQELHSYQTPEFLVLAIEAGSSTYLSWLGACLASAQGTAV
jgi:periplasmic divalent cation tolerance protein